MIASKVEVEVIEKKTVTWTMTEQDEYLLQNLIVVLHDHIYGYPRNTPQRLARWVEKAYREGSSYGSSLADLIRGLPTGVIRGRLGTAIGCEDTPPGEPRTVFDEKNGEVEMSLPAEPLNRLRNMWEGGDNWDRLALTVILRDLFDGFDGHLHRIDQALAPERPAWRHVVLAGNFRQARDFTREQGWAPHEYVIVSTPQALRGIRGPIEVHRVGTYLIDRKPDFIREVEANIEIIERTAP